MNVAIDGAGVPMRPVEMESVRGRQKDGGAKTREAEAASVCRTGGTHPGTGRPGTAPGGRVRSHWSVTGAKAVPAVRCRFMNSRWADFLNWRAGRPALA